MLARFQALIAGTLFFVVVASSLWGASAGRPSAGPILVLLIAIGYLAVLAIEFAWLARSYAPRDDLRPRARQLFRSWIAEALVGPRVFLWRQPFRSRLYPDHLPSGAAGRRGVLLVHGFFCNRGLWNPWLRQLRADDVPFVAVDLEPIFGSIESYGATIAQACRKLQDATGVAPVILAHSMGGLAVRAWLAANPEAVFHRLITIASPHAGTRLGAHSRSANIRQMRYGSAWLGELARRETPSQRAKFVCFWGHCDNVVFPTRSATLPGADNRHLDATPHVRMAYHPAVFAALRECLRSDA